MNRTSSHYDGSVNSAFQATEPGISNASHWNADVGEAWAGVFHARKLDRHATVLEIGPGFTDKLAFGLATLNFCGRIIVVDPCDAARCWAVARYRQLLPHAEVHSLTHPIPDSTVLDGQRIDAIVSNHIFDDLLLNIAVPSTTSQQLFSVMRPDAPCPSLFLETWKDLLSKPTRLDMLVTQVIDDFITYLNSVNPKFVAVNHYPSWRHYQSGLAVIDAYSLRIIRELHQRIRNGSITYTNRIGAEQIGPICWLVATL